MGRRGSALAAVVLAGGVLAAGMFVSVEATAQEYTCRDRRSGRVVANPPSRTESQHFENANPRVDCFRKGAPVTSSRDEYRERRRGYDRDDYSDRRRSSRGWDW